MIAGGHFGNWLLRINMKAHVGSNIPEIKIINLCHQISIRNCHELSPNANKMFSYQYNEIFHFQNTSSCFD